MLSTTKMTEEFLLALAGSTLLVNLILSLLFWEVKRVISKRNLPSTKDKLLRWGVFVVLCWLLISSLQVNALFLTATLPLTYHLFLWFYVKLLFRGKN